MPPELPRIIRPDDGGDVYIPRNPAEIQPEEPVDRLFLTKLYNDAERDRPITKDRWMKGAAHVIDYMMETAQEYSPTDVGPDFAAMVLLHDDPDVRARAEHAIAEEVNRDNVPGEIVANIIHRLSDTALGHYRAYRDLREQYSEDQY